MSTESRNDTVLSHDQRMWRFRILVSTYMAYAGYYLCRKVFTICKTTLAAELDVGLDQIAHIWTAYLVAYMLGQFISSFVGRKWGPRVLLLGGLGISILINIVFGFANSYWTFLSFMFFNGLVQASGWPGAVGGVAEWLRNRERGTIMGIWSTSYLVGNLVVKYLGGLLLAQMGWRYAFFGCTLFAFGIWWIIYFWQRDKPEDVGLEPVVERLPEEARSVAASNAEHVSFSEYIQLLLNPIIPLMGICYFCVKFLRYALDSWLPTFLDLQGFDVGQASYYSGIFDYAGLAGAVVAGWALDRVFRGNWAVLCLIMGLGTVGGYLLVVIFGANPYALAICFGVVGFMIYGPDTLLCGAASVEVAGERNGVAVAGLVNGIGSIGPVIQEEVIGWIMKGDDAQANIHSANLLALSISVAFVVLTFVLVLRLHAVRKRARQEGSAGP